MVVLVAGSSGQLGQSLQFIAKNHSAIDFVFCDSQKLDITDKLNVDTVFNETKPDFCINAAAYTAVDKAESDAEKAHLINVVGCENLAVICKKLDVVLIHVSTDFVFDGSKKIAYSELDIPNPTGIYGQTKLDGEKIIASIWSKHFIIRTSWVYSQFGNNFMKTMLRLASERDNLGIVNDQIGTPTNAVDLAETLVKIIKINKNESVTGNFGIYNFSNEGQCSWFDFAKKIFEINKILIDLKPISTTEFPTPAKRPKFSVLDKSKIKATFNIKIKSWEESLAQLY
jgi:dTDP-4-dehydrorhamnose reductase